MVPCRMGGLQSTSKVPSAAKDFVVCPRTFTPNPHTSRHARRIYLSTLIDELGGDLALIARYRDRSSEKTLRKTIRSYGLMDALKAARKRGPRQPPWTGNRP